MSYVCGRWAVPITRALLQSLFPASSMSEREWNPQLDLVDSHEVGGQRSLQRLTLDA